MYCWIFFNRKTSFYTSLFFWHPLEFETKCRWAPTHRKLQLQNKISREQDEVSGRVHQAWLSYPTWPRRTGQRWILFFHCKLNLRQVFQWDLCKWGNRWEPGEQWQYELSRRSLVNWDPRRSVLSPLANCEQFSGDIENLIWASGAEFPSTNPEMDSSPFQLAELSAIEQIPEELEAAPAE